ncbi:uncharacterized protein METZ01_LOCUS212670, partial [marine metagenome]
VEVSNDEIIVQQSAYRKRNSPDAPVTVENDKPTTCTDGVGTGACEVRSVIWHHISFIIAPGSPRATLHHKSMGRI